MFQHLGPTPRMGRAHPKDGLFYTNSCVHTCTCVCVLSVFFCMSLAPEKVNLLCAGVGSGEVRGGGRSATGDGVLAGGAG